MKKEKGIVWLSPKEARKHFNWKSPSTFYVIKKNDLDENNTSRFKQFNGVWHIRQDFSKVTDEKDIEYMRFLSHKLHVLAKHTPYGYGMWKILAEKMETNITTIHSYFTRGNFGRNREKYKKAVEEFLKDLSQPAKQELEYLLDTEHKFKWSSKNSKDSR